jgi:hypothetical protein
MFLGSISAKNMFNKQLGQKF